jgi:hypothetical protein
MKAIVFASSLLAVAACDQVKSLHAGNPHGEAPRAVEQAQVTHGSGDIAIDLQGGRMDCSDSGVRGFYDITREAFADGPEKVDLEAYKQKTFASQRQGMKQEGIAADQIELWIDHIKDIPRQMIGIVRADPKVLESCEKFSIALSGPP